MSPAVRTSIAFAVAGLGFTAANVVLARALPPTEYGRFSLAVALLHIAIAIAPLGSDGLVNRGSIAPGRGLLIRSLVQGGAVGVLVVGFGGLFYGLDWLDLALVLAGTVAGGAGNVAAAGFQAQQRFRMSFALHQSGQVFFALCALTAWIAGAESATVPLLIVAVGHLLSAIYGWTRQFRERGRGADGPVGTFPWREGLAFAGINGVGLLLIQLERLVIPRVLTLRDLATFGVLAAFVIAPFRVLQAGVGYTLLPRLRAAPTIAARRRLFLDEAAIVAVLVIAGSVALWYITPPLVQFFLDGKYTLEPALILAALVTGIARLLSGFARSAVNALADTSELGTMSVAGWVALAVAALAAAIGGRWGLTGVVYGAGVGWLAQAATGAVIAAPYLHLRDRRAAGARRVVPDPAPSNPEAP